MKVLKIRKLIIGYQAVTLIYTDLLDHLKKHFEGLVRYAENPLHGMESGIEGLSGVSPLISLVQCILHIM